MLKSGKQNVTQNEWFGLHLLVHNNAEIDALMSELTALANLGINFIIAEVNYHYAFETHPELQAESVISPLKASTLAQKCIENNIQLIPQFQCLGHQSWAKTTFPLLEMYPEFDETPGKYPNNEGIYCRSWCPQHPDVNNVIFGLIDELASAFQATTVHIGMDEVFLIGSEFCPRCAGHDPSQLFAKTVNDFYQHIVMKNNCRMMMWGDRLLSSDATGYGEWEASENNTHDAIDFIPKDIIICDWHYLNRESYPSIPLFLDKGFQVIASGWHELDASEAFYEYAMSFNDANMLGYLCTTWGKVQPGVISTFEALRAVSKKRS